MTALKQLTDELIEYWNLKVECSRNVRAHDTIHTNRQSMRKNKLQMRT